ncbi:hypothetical protein VZT92_017437 [Zoarces viviparus]|uniref:Ig-like domain-containing protein n=1 Tax=Zoarces viviparus TaxID=48416 RepID=A0AAW1ES47_ZOAVI
MEVTALCVRLMRPVMLLLVAQVDFSYSQKAGPCEIKDPYPALHSGEYWCVMGAKTSNTVNITVTDGPVILESPVHPVIEGDATALSCRVQQASPNLTPEFFKDGHLMERSSTEHVNILSVSKSNEGLYKCTIPGAGESPGSWLTVRAVHGETHPSDHSCHVYLVLRTVFTIVMVALLLLLVGLLHFGKVRVTQK